MAIKIRPRRLVLAKETVRVLARGELILVAGGLGTYRECYPDGAVPSDNGNDACLDGDGTSKCVPAGAEDSSRCGLT